MLTVKLQCTFRKQVELILSEAWYSFNISHFATKAQGSAKLAFKLEDYFAECLATDYQMEIVALKVLSDPIFTIS